MKIKCLFCNDIIENNEIHNIIFCNCGKTGLDYNPHHPRIIFERNINEKKMYEIIDLHNVIGREK